LQYIVHPSAHAEKPLEYLGNYGST